MNDNLHVISPPVTMSVITIRPYEEPRDAGFIFSSFPKSAYYGSPLKRVPRDKEARFTFLYEFLKSTLPGARVFIACMYDSPDTILGYSIIDRQELQWVYVKEGFRNQGLATLLTKNKNILRVNDRFITRVGLAILRDHPALFKEQPQEEQLEERRVKDVLSN